MSQNSDIKSAPIFTVTRRINIDFVFACGKIGVQAILVPLASLAI
jgi:hypothetical protein